MFKIACRFYPGLNQFPESERYAAAGYLWRSLLFTAPSVIGLVWLIKITDTAILLEHWLFLLILFGILLVLSKLWLELYFVTASGSYRSERRSFWGEAMWSGILVFGPTVAWLGVILPWAGDWLQRRESSVLQRFRAFSRSMFRMSVLLPTLVEVSIYERLGGRFPLSSLDLPAVLPAVIATLVGFTLSSLMIMVSQGISRIMSPVSAEQRAESRRLAILMAMLGPFAGLVAIMPAGLYSLAGWGAYFSFLGIMMIGAVVIDRLSRAVENARHRVRELEQLQRLSQSLLQGVPDGAGLFSRLEAVVPAVFPLCYVAIRLYPDTLGAQAIPTPLILPSHWSGPDSSCWDWERERTTPLILQPRDTRPWLGRGGREGMIILPVIELHTRRVLGRIYLHREQRSGSLQQVLPALQWLADLIASTCNRAEIYRLTMAEQVRQERVTEELRFARSVQTSFLPTEQPHVVGWQLAATLEPARETSGDFYDLIPLHGGRLAIVIADVADKGLGAALYMALSRTLIRAYAIDYALRYAQTYVQQLAHLIQTVNSRIVTDTKSDLFVTLFFGVLDLQTGVLTYVNAGHNPPYLFRYHRGRRVKALRRTGPPIGILENARWTRRSIKIEPGETLVLYTDGLTEAMSSEGGFFGDDAFQRTIRSCLRFPPEAMCTEILRAVAAFEGDLPRADDITLLILQRDTAAKPIGRKQRPD